MKKNCILALVFTFFSIQSFSQSWSLIWSDEFDSTAIDTKKWNFDIGTGCDIDLCGWGNQEKEYYRKENVTVANGSMKITAKKETFQTQGYTSGRINTRGKAVWKYGKMEAKIKMTKGQGLWHAFWMLPQDLVYGGWPKSGEIDILEYLGHHPNVVQSTLHFGDFYPNNKYAYDQKISTDYSTDFHLYTVIWEENYIAFYVDGNLIGEHTPESIAPNKWPFDQTFYFILNTAIGGNLTNNTINDAVLPGYMEVDYVRVYSKNPEFDGVVINGPEAICNKDTGYVFSVGKKENWSFDWTVPQGAEIVAGQGSDSVRINFKNATSGIVSLKVTNDTSLFFSTIKKKVQVSSCDTLKGSYGSMAVIPGKIEAENFDNGGALRSYYDIDSANQGKEYRPEGVDIELTSDAGGGYNIGWTESGEWLNYTVLVKKTASYDIIVQAAATTSNNSVTLYFDDIDVTGAITTKNTGGWQTYFANVKKGVHLDSGMHVMRLKFNGTGINVNFINIQEAQVNTGINPMGNERRMTAYPNPVTNECMISMSEKITASVVVSTIMGAEVIRMDTYKPADIIDFSTVPAGIYFITVKTNRGSTTQKIIKR